MITITNHPVVMEEATQPAVSNIRKGQAVVATFSLLTIGTGQLGKTKGLIDEKTANKIDFIGSVGLLISSAPIIYKKLASSQLLENIAKCLMGDATK